MIDSGPLELGMRLIGPLVYGGVLYEQSMGIYKSAASGMSILVHYIDLQGAVSIVFIMGGRNDPKNGWWIGPPGNQVLPSPQRIASYALSPNRQRPMAGWLHAAIFNTFRRFRHQVLYVVPPFIIAFAVMNWANEK
ncbi:ubiquinol-cytochrome C reductase complex subunit UcrQ [Penicillium lagena]|uniref:ubiquinol-cytochrome C reductase complex subunit UcrQ n=1 Tax=Penicillium lagena TaxID=94218 RepID=UPI00254167DA|nr:ubiquinol-cytochrome C reductase complex subunit UcrQ [Penicillium lagena]KAJ5602148.1 ubiquinol-cytochrome C reductase complex subunit UcrQ [Penicillium lagena]